LKAAVYDGAFDIKIKDVPEPTMEATDVLIQPKFVGICGTDLAAWEYGLYGSDTILGHEFAGEIVAISDSVTKFKVGDRVVPNSLLPCKTCEFCKANRYALCEDMQMVGISMNGGLAELVALPEEVLHRLPSSISYEEASFVEPLSVVMRGFKRVEFSPDMSVLILGAGPIGLLSLLLAKNKGTEEIYVSEIKEPRFELANDLGATHVINPKKESLSLRLESLTDGKGPDLVIETTGAPNPTSEAFTAVRRGGTILVLGICEEPVEADFMRGVLNELKVVFSYLGYEEFPEAIELISNGSIDVKPLISKIIPLDRIVEDGFEDLTSESSSNIKILVKCN
jgi:(R,R)-butanediol dehydrogenase/meso-butanediol dehydrogenase/diacetyl reductase